MKYVYSFRIYISPLIYITIDQKEATPLDLRFTLMCQPHSRTRGNIQEATVSRIHPLGIPTLNVAVSLRAEPQIRCSQ